jgi:hypothetical protein
MYYQIVRIIIIIYQTSNVKVVLNTILTNWFKFIHNLLHLSSSNFVLNLPHIH